MSIDTHVSGGSSERLVFPVRNMFSSLRIDILFGQPEVYYMNGAHLFGWGAPQKEVFRFNIPIYQIFGMNIFNPVQLVTLIE